MLKCIIKIMASCHHYLDIVRLVPAVCSVEAAGFQSQQPTTPRQRQWTSGRTWKAQGSIGGPEPLFQICHWCERLDQQALGQGI